jgi:MoaA/NifB/PqqE/SkfB family radical SAM enzyme
MGLKYTKMKAFHYKEKLDSLPKESKEILPPVHVRIKPTNVCAHSCWYCAYKVDNLQLGQDMVTRDSIPLEKMLQIIDDLDDMGVKAVTFSGGGDPFHYKHLLQAAKALAASSMSFASLTNGARLTGEVSEVFSEAATWLRVSIDGWDAKSYAHYRGVKETEFGKVIGNMESFQKLGGKCVLGVSYIIDEKNAAHIFDFARRMRDIGVASVKMSPCITSNSGAESNRYHEPFYNAAKEQIAKAQSELASDSFEVNDAYHYLENKFEKTYTWCPYLQMLMVIGADLNVYACQDKAYNLDNGCLGSIKDQSFKEFWFDNKERFYKINPSVDCNNHCVANPKNELILDYLEADTDNLGFV